MAKRKKAGESVHAYFQRVFEENPKWLKKRKNDEVFARYRADHGLAADAPIEDSVRHALANKKSIMRKQKGKKKSESMEVARPALSGAAVARMYALEEQLDDCLASALTLDRDNLAGVIKLLRNARDSVVVQLNAANGKK